MGHSGDDLERAGSMGSTEVVTCRRVLRCRQQSDSEVNMVRAEASDELEQRGADHHFLCVRINAMVLGQKLTQRVGSHR